MEKIITHGDFIHLMNYEWCRAGIPGRLSTGLINGHYVRSLSKPRLIALVQRINREHFIYFDDEAVDRIGEIIDQFN